MTEESDAGRTADQRYKLYLDRHAELNALVASQQSTLDKWLLTLSTGSFGLTISLLPSLNAAEGIKTEWLLITSWSAFALAMVLVLASFWVSTSAASVEIQVNDKAYQNPNTPPRRNHYVCYLRVLNIQALMVFIIGVILLVIFAGRNLL